MIAVGSLGVSGYEAGGVLQTVTSQFLPCACLEAMCVRPDASKVRSVSKEHLSPWDCSSAAFGPGGSLRGLGLQGRRSVLACENELVKARTLARTGAFWVVF